MGNLLSSTLLWCCLFFNFTHFLILENLSIFELALSGEKGLEGKFSNTLASFQMKYCQTRILKKWSDSYRDSSVRSVIVFSRLLSLDYEDPLTFHFPREMHAFTSFLISKKSSLVYYNYICSGNCFRCETRLLSFDERNNRYDPALGQIFG